MNGPGDAAEDWRGGLIDLFVGVLILALAAALLLVIPGRK